MISLETSRAAFAEAQTLMPGGVNSPVRSYSRIGCPPPFIAWPRAVPLPTSTATNTSTTLCPMVRCSWAMYPTA